MEKKHGRRNSKKAAASFERAARGGAGAKAKYVLRLYVTGVTQRSVEAIQNIKTICEEHLRGRYDLEVIDLYQNPGRAKEAQVIAAPTLIKQLPEPLKRIIGDLSNKEKVLHGLDVHPKE